MKRIAVIGAILTSPKVCQKNFNDIVSEYRGIVKGRMGIPFDEVDMSVISLTLIAELDVINTLTGKLGNLEGVKIKTAISDVISKEGDPSVY